ncbi:anion-transporting ATPase-domain-containing protein, partial [Baffinella frigidus]
VPLFGSEVVCVPLFDTEVTSVYGLRALGGVAFKENLQGPTECLFDTEVTSVYGLRALGGVAFKENLQAQYGGLFEKGSKSQFVFVGGKGGVGKTSTSSALGVQLAGFVGGKGGVSKSAQVAALGMQLADAGLKTLIISTDPAHSLGDCLAVKLAGEPVEIEGTQGNLWAMEVDTEEALEKFKSKLRSVSQMGGRLGDLGSKIGLDEFADILENPPPGTDEVVALGDVMDVMREGTFDRVIVDTAPTGHTLRLLSFPDFLDDWMLNLALSNTFTLRLLSFPDFLDGFLQK